MGVSRKRLAPTPLVRLQCQQQCEPCSSEFLAFFAQAHFSSNGVKNTCNSIAAVGLTLARSLAR